MKRETLHEVVKSACNKEGIAKHCPERITEALYEATKKEAIAMLEDMINQLYAICAPAIKESTDQKERDRIEIQFRTTLSTIVTSAYHYCDIDLRHYLKKFDFSRS